MGVLIRGLLVLFGIGLMVLGIVAIAALPDGHIAGLTWVALGGLLVVVVAAERQRYRSEAAERTNAPPGPGGGERRDEIIEPRFAMTDEVFIDPTTGHRMRVLADPKTGERRYVAEA
jgi:hypothetical protein